jgi:iron complex transport system ATP-binding protein
MTAVAAVHDLELASRYWQRLVQMDWGAVVAEGARSKCSRPSDCARLYGVVAEVAPDAATGGLSITVLEAIEEGATTS